MDTILRMLFDSIPRECSTNACSRSSDLSLRMFGLPSRSFYFRLLTFDFQTLQTSDLKDNEHRLCESQQRVCARISLASQKLNATAKVQLFSCTCKLSLKKIKLFAHMHFLSYFCTKNPPRMSGNINGG